MGWYPAVIKNTLAKNLTKEFYNDLFELCQSAVKQDDFSKIPESFYDVFSRNNSKFEKVFDDLRYDAFNSDHMEHIGSWLYNRNIWPLFKKHKIDGVFLLYDTDGDGRFRGIQFRKGIPYNIEVELNIIGTAMSDL